jgi:hypothetical protein
MDGILRESRIDVQPEAQEEALTEIETRPIPVISAALRAKYSDELALACKQLMEVRRTRVLYRRPFGVLCSQWSVIKDAPSSQLLKPLTCDVVEIVGSSDALDKFDAALIVCWVSNTQYDAAIASTLTSAQQSMPCALILFRSDSSDTTWDAVYIS